MRTNCTFILVAVFFFYKTNCFAQAVIDSTISEHYQTSKFNVAIFAKNSVELFPGTERFTPTKQEVEFAELSLINHLSDLNSERQNQSTTPVIDKNIHKYKRQYFGYIDLNGNKILFINSFWKKDKESDQLWLVERVMVLDGGSYFWNIKFNLTTNELFDLDVNGEI